MTIQAFAYRMRYNRADRPDHVHPLRWTGMLAWWAKQENRDLFRIS